MYDIWIKTLKEVILFTTLLIPFISCNQSCFQVVTHNDVAYWSRYWRPDHPYGSIVEFSKKDSTMKYLDHYWIYDDYTPEFWSLRFKIKYDTLFSFVNRKGNILTYDTLPIVSYSKNTIIFRNNESEHVKWHRISTKYAKRMINAPNQVKLSYLLKTRKHDNVTGIHDINWKLYGYGDVSTGIVRKSDALKYRWMNIITFWKEGVMSGLSTYNSIRGEYLISESDIEFLGFGIKREMREELDGNEFCEILPQCKKYKITNNWLQLFYDDGKKYLIFRVSR